MRLSSIKTTALKELRSYFLSPVALIFLGVFLVVTLFVFFTQARFFARNLADVRPLFSWLPLLLVFLVSAVTMRQWSEEQKMGTLEVLLTLPIRTSELVLGKFLAGLALVTLALGLTLPLPITVSLLGQLDWGPVIGGYAAALLLSSAYLAIGLCVSARTDNQIVALMVTAVLGAVLYLLGSESVTALFGNRGAELLQALGTGSRFASVERGVLDVRDFAYYLSLTGFFLVLNVYFLEQKRLEKQPASGTSRKGALRLLVLLAGLNALALNVWLAPISRARVDLTADGEYSISDVTEHILADLDEPLVISGYFSSKTHPLLAPLVPRIRDFLTEYEVRGNGKVTVEVIDPNSDEAVEQEINEQFGIKSVPFRISDRHEESVVNSYFHIVVKYGAEYEVLSFGDIIEVQADDNDVQVRLRNLEYDLTRAIKKVTQGFQSVDAVLARADKAVKLTAYISADKLPPEFAEVPARLKKVAEKLAKKSGGKLSFEQLDPTKDQALAQKIAKDYGFQPMAIDPFNPDTFYFHILFQQGDHLERIFPQGELTELALQDAIEGAIKRGTPGFLKSVGLFTATPEQPAANPFAPQPPQQQPDFQALERTFVEDYNVTRLDLDNGIVPQEIEVLLVAKPGRMSEKNLFAIDQFLMRGGSVIVLSGAYDIKPERTGVTAVPVDEGLKKLLAHYGVKIEDAFVMDPQNTNFPVPVQERRGAFVLERIQMMPYPFFADIRPDGFEPGHLALSALPSVAMTWASPLTVENAPKDAAATVLLKTSEGSWKRVATQMQPDFDKYPATGFEVPEKDRGQLNVAVSLVGTFPSYYADKPSPLFGDDPGNPEAAKGDRTGRTLKTSTPDARLVVVGSSEFASDLVSQIAMQIGGGQYRGNMMLVHNLVDWSLEDTDLLQIRSAGAFARTLKPLTEGERTTYELVNYAVVVLALLAVLGLAITRRRLVKPITLTEEDAA